MISSGSVQTCNESKFLVQPLVLCGCCLLCREVQTCCSSLGAMDLIEELMSADSEHLPIYVCPTVFQVLGDICC